MGGANTLAVEAVCVLCDLACDAKCQQEWAYLLEHICNLQASGEEAIGQVSSFNVMKGAPLVFGSKLKYIILTSGQNCGP